MDQLLNSTKVVVASSGAAAGSTNVNGTVIDMAGYDGALIIATLGTLTATQVTKLKAQDGSQSGGGDQADIAGAETAAAADGDSNKALILDVWQPRKRYLRPVLERGTANAVLASIVVILYRGRVRPVTPDATVSQSLAVVAAS